MKQHKVILFLLFIICIYLFLVGIHCLSSALILLNNQFVFLLFSKIKHPIIGFFVGIFTTAILQSSSATNSIAITMVGTGIISLEQVIPIVMGAHIGTTTTNTFISLSMIFHKEQFKRAFAASTIHDFYNILTAFILFPLEIYFHIIQKSALFTYQFINKNMPFTASFQSPIKSAILLGKNYINQYLVNYPNIYLLISIILIISMLILIINILKYSFIETIKKNVNLKVFDNPIKSWSIGAFFTFLVQSSSITTSLVIPLAADGALTLEQIYPYTVGANFGTGFTTFLAALSLNHISFVAAMTTIFFDIIGSCIIYPMPIIGSIPLVLAKKFANISSKFKVLPIIYLIIVFILLPMAIILF